SLPDYLVPSIFVPLNELPLTASGKVDRKALPAPDGRPELESAYVSPRTSAENELVRIWSEALRVERVGIHDNFFALGGDSILSIQVVSRARQAGLDLSTKDIFLRQTIAELSAVVRERTLEVPVHRPVISGPVPL